MSAARSACCISTGATGSRSSRAFFHTLSTRRADTATERLAWLIIFASIPAGVLGLAFEHQLRTITAKPEIAAIFLVVNGLILFAAEWFRRRAEVRELAIREGAKADGGRKLETLEYRESFVIGAAQSTALVAGISRDGVTMGAGLARGLDHSDSARFAFLLATPIILAAGLVKLPDLVGHLGNGIRGQALVGCISAAITAVFTVGFLVRYFKTRTLTPFAIYCVVFGGAMVIYTPDLRQRAAGSRAGPAACTIIDAHARPEDPSEDVRDPQPGLAGGRAAAPDQPARRQARRGSRCSCWCRCSCGRAALRQPRQPARDGGAAGRHGPPQGLEQASKRP